ncbi:MAG TPA: PSD1 and planctomycete cytochrome C domain-containing protein [Verrucomicrobiae bacterium]|nr:PSD1 and planctomycete cytochrome C domain-containing protein [Verrucomicrobiae bacterium]
MGLALCLGATGTAAMAADKSAGVEFFESKIRPVLVDNCYPCHSHQSAKVKGGLLLDTREDLLKGGDTGPAIKPGDVEQSLLIKAVRYTDDDLRMPPKNKKLAPAQIAALEAWVKMGAPDPRTSQAGLEKVESIREKARSHWAFQPVRMPNVPVVQHKHWVRMPVDKFILARLEAAKLPPPPMADKRTLIRRATFDLIGLPPTPQEVAAFKADSSPDAFARVVDRLLASPRYGERWGRHWLDVARYADTKGYFGEADRHFPYAYTYRDYVIRAFNEDLPYDQFLKEQIAGDLLPTAKDKRTLAALGYLTVGRRFNGNINDVIDDQIDVVCRGMMGLTVECARCHDHKFDPIPSRDYYSLYGIFASSMEPAEEPLLGIEAPKKAHEEYLVEHKKRADALDHYRKEQERTMAAQLRDQSGGYLLAAYEAQGFTNKSDAERIARAHKLDPEVLQRWTSALDGWHKSQSDIFAPWFAFAALPEKDFPTRAKEVSAKFGTNSTLARSINPLVARAFATNSPDTMKDVAERYGKLFTEIDKRWQDAVAATNSPSVPELPDTNAEALRQILYASDAPANLPRTEFDRLYDTPTAQKLRELQRNIDELDATSQGAPPRAMALVDSPNPHDTRIFIRGNSENQGAEAPREFLEFLSGTDRKPFHHGSGRLELAEAIANRDNPLTARVIVNRVWMYHFGSPLVATPSDFGLRSEPPTHPELLDYLAARFVAGGWSIKNLHRLIMLSGAYRQSSGDNPKCDKIDPDDKLLWRMNRQRLDFEAMRDSLLAVSAKLDSTPGGHAVEITDPASTRRTIFGYVDRQNLPDEFRAFDFASPDSTSPRRFYTTVPQQALFLMNSPFIVEQARRFAKRASFASTDQQRIRLLYQLAYQRDPTLEEMDLARQFIHAPNPAPKSHLDAWQKYAQILLMSDEFAFVD